MIEEADFQEIGNAAIDLCVFVDKLRLGKKHREEANKLTHNVLNLIKRTGKIEEKEPLTKGNKMKKLKIQFWKAEKALAMQILEQEGLLKEKNEGHVRIRVQPEFLAETLYLRGKEHKSNLCIPEAGFNTNTERDEYLQKAVNAITDELFTGGGELKVGEMCEVSNEFDFKNIMKLKLIYILPEEYDKRYLVDFSYAPFGWLAYEYARPITKRTEPTIKECGQLITYTWEEK